MDTTKKRLQQLAGLLNEQMFDVHDQEAPLSGSEPELEDLELDLPQEVANDEIKNYLAGYVSYLRAIHLWFHAAHHMTKGTGFSGDHEDLYQRIYEGVQDEVDGAIEKAVGITNDENLACPIMMATNAANIMKRIKCEVNAPAIEIAKAGLNLEKDYLEFLEEMFAALEKHNVLTLGLNDQLAASANAHETYVFLLQQRVKQ